MPVDSRDTVLARSLWGELSETQVAQLQTLGEQFGLSILRGDLKLLEGKWYVTHSGLLRLARRKHCCGIKVEVLASLSDPGRDKWVCRATVYQSPRSKGFAGLGDAAPYNINPVLRGAELRIAETRAVNRALRKAYGIGICSVEELSAPERVAKPEMERTRAVHTNRSHTFETTPFLRDRLLLLIRQHDLDGGQVKRYALHFCGTGSLREATREQIERLVDHLGQLATEDKPKLLQQLAGCSAAVENHKNGEEDKEAA